VIAVDDPAVRNGAARDDAPRMSWPTFDQAQLDVIEPLVALLKARRNANEGRVPSVWEEEQLEAEVRKTVGDALEAPGGGGLQLSVVARLREDRTFREQIVLDTMILASHLYPVSHLIYGYEVENVLCFGHDSWAVDAGGHFVALDGRPFDSEVECIEFFKSLCNLQGVSGVRDLTYASPLAVATLGSVVRITAAVRPVIGGTSGIEASIRVPARSSVRCLDDYVSQGIMSGGMARLLHAAVTGRANILIAGSIGVGKTTMLKVCCGLTPPSEVILTIEDGAELHLRSDRGDGRPWHPHVFELNTVVDSGDGKSERWSLGDLVRAALRFRLSRLVLGESRGAEMAEVAKAMTSGHDGSMTTIHADSAHLAVEKAARYLQEGPQFRGNASLALQTVSEAIHLVVHLGLTSHGRRVTGILATTPGGKGDYLYRLTSDGGWERPVRWLREYPALAARLEPILGSEVPVP